MSNDSANVLHGAYAGLPILTEDNFADWDMQVIIYLTGSGDHARVVMPTRQSDGTYLYPATPTPADDAASNDEKRQAANNIASWEKSEHIVLGCIMATASKLHRETILKHRKAGTAMWVLYAEICDYHQQRNAPRRQEAWMQFFAIHKSATESYMSYYRRVEAAHDKILCVTPPDQSPEDRAKERTLFALLSGLPHNDPLRTSLATQKDITLADVASTLLHFDTRKRLAETESGAYIAHGAPCWTCGDRDHLSRDCPHREVVQQFITKRKNTGDSGYKSSKWKGKGRETTANATANATHATSASDAARREKI